MSAQDRPTVTVNDPGSDAPPVDLLASAVAPERPRDWRAVLATVIGVTGVGVAGTGIALAVALSGGGPQPEAVLPADVFALAKVDLDPAGGQKMAAYELAKRFPTLEVQGAGSLQDDLLRRLFLDDDEVDYDRQVRPWIGARAAVAGAPDADGDGEPEVLVAVAYEDRAAAEELLPSLVAEAVDGEPAFFAFSDREPYVLLAGSQRAADAAAGAGRVLADVQRYRDDAATLDGDQVAVAWADLDAVWAALPDVALEAAGDLYGEDLQPRGRLIAGVHLESDSIEMSGRGFGLDLGSDALNAYAFGTGTGEGLVQDLPAGAVMAMSVAGLGQQVERLLDLASAGFGVAGPGPEPGLGAGAVTEPLEQLGEQLGIRIPEDLVLLLGDETAVGVYDVAGEPEVGARTRGEDAAAALAVAERLLEGVAEQAQSFGGGEFTYEQCVQGLPEQDPNVLELCRDLPRDADVEAPQPPDVGAVGALPDGVAYGTDQELLDRITGSGGLGSSELFQRAVPDLEGASSVLFADLQAALALFDTGQDQLEALEAFGASSTGGPDGRFQVRLTVR